MSLLLFVDLLLHKLQSYMLLTLELVNVLDPRLDGCVHLSNFVLFSARVLIVVALVLSHVAPAHLSVLHYELLVKLRIQLVVLQTKRLN